MVEGIAVDRGVVVRRYVPWRSDGLGKIAPLSRVHVDAFDVDDRPHARFQDGKRLVMRHPVFVVEEAIVGQLHRHAVASLK